MIWGVIIGTVVGMLLLGYVIHWAVVMAMNEHIDSLERTIKNAADKITEAVRESARG